jgi:hypothetical protein
MLVMAGDVVLSQCGIASANKTDDVTSLLQKRYANYGQQDIRLWPVVHVYMQFLNLNSVNQLIFVIVKYGVLFEVRTGFLNNI